VRNRLSITAAVLLLSFSGCTEVKPAPPAAPRTVILTWQAAAKATAYNIYRARPGAQYEKIGTSATTSYTDAQVPGRTSFFYTVTAVNENGESAPANRLVVPIP
jgi:fibronectin type 3 domain-containing protein